MAHERTFAQRARFLQMYIAPASLLAGPSEDERYSDGELSLRELASQDGFCYVRVLRRIGATDLYQAEVAATPQLLQRHPYAVFFTEEQLYTVLPWDVRTQEMLASDPDRLYSLLYIHAAEVRPLVSVAPACPEEEVSHPAEPLSAMEVVIPATSDMPTVALSIVEDAQPTIIAAGALAVQRACFRTVNKLVGTAHMQHVFLDALLATLTLRLHQAREESQTRLLKRQCTLIERVQGWYQRTRQRVVGALPVFDERQQRLLWRVTIGVPSSCFLVA